MYGLIFLYHNRFKKILLGRFDAGDAINSQIGYALHTKLRTHDDKLLRRGYEKFIRIKLLADTRVYQCSWQLVRENIC